MHEGREARAKFDCDRRAVRSGAGCMSAATASAPPRPILCAFDGSDGARRALRYAQAAAAARGAELIVAHVVPAGEELPEAVEEFARIEHLGGEAEALMTCAMAADDASVAAAQMAAKGRPAECVVLRGEPAEAILALAEARNVGEIVLGRRGRSAAAAALLGSVSRRVAAASRWPCTIVP